MSHKIRPICLQFSVGLASILAFALGAIPNSQAQTKTWDAEGFAKGNFIEGSTSTAGFGALTLSAPGSTLDFGTGTIGMLSFAAFTPRNFSLTIDHWSSGTTDRLTCASDQSANLSSFDFSGYASGAMEVSLDGGYDEVIPITAVPEPSTYAASALALGVISYQCCRRLRRRRLRWSLPERWLTSLFPRQAR